MAVTSTGQITIVDVNDGKSYVVQISGGVLSFTWDATGANPTPTSTAFSVTLLENGVAVTPSSYSWSASGNLSGTGTATTFTPSVATTFSATANTYVSVSVVYNGTTYTGSVAITSNRIGTQGPSVVVNASRALSFTSTDGTLDSSQANINLAASVFGITSPTYVWTFSGFQTAPTNSGNANMSITQVQFGTSASATVTCTVNGAYSQTLTLVRLEKSTAAAGANQTYVDANGQIQGVSSGSGTMVQNNLTRYQELQGLMQYFDGFNDTTNFANDWEVSYDNLAAGPTSSNVANVGSKVTFSISKASNNQTNLQGYRLRLRGKRLIKYNPELLYQVLFNTTSSTDASCTVMLGVCMYTANGTILDTTGATGLLNNNMPFCSFNGYGNTGGRYAGYVSGTTASPDSYDSRQPDSPSALHTNCAYISLLVIVECRSGSTYGWNPSGTAKTFSFSLLSAGIKSLSGTEELGLSSPAREKFYSPYLLGTLSGGVVGGAKGIFLPTGYWRNGTPGMYALGTRYTPAAATWNTVQGLYSAVPMTNYIYAYPDSTSSNKFSLRATTCRPYVGATPDPAINILIKPDVFAVGATSLSDYWAADPMFAFTCNAAIVTETITDMPGSWDVFSSGGTRYLTNTTRKSLPKTEFSVSMYFNMTAFPATSAAVTLFQFGTTGLAVQIYNSAGSCFLRLYASSNGSSYNIANGTLGTTALSLNTTYHLLVLKCPEDGTLRVLLSGAQQISVAMAATANIASFTTTKIFANTSNGSIPNGRFGCFAVLPHTISPTEMNDAMYQNGTQGVWVGYNPVTRLWNSYWNWLPSTLGFIGEVGASTLTTYTDTGYYTTGWVLLATNTAYTFNHNLGGDPSEYIITVYSRTKTGSVVVAYGRNLFSDSGAAATVAYGTAVTDVTRVSLTLPMQSDISYTAEYPIGTSDTGQTSGEAGWYCVVARRPY